MRYKIELAQFHTIEVEAESEKEAEDKVAVMDDEDILSKSTESEGLFIWEVTEL